MTSLNSYFQSMNNHNIQMVKNMLQVIIEEGNEIINFVKTFNDENGFMFSQNSKINVIMNNKIIIRDSHSGCSGACTLRNCQYILNNYNQDEIESHILNKDDFPSESCSESELVHATQLAIPLENNLVDNINLVNDASILVDDINYNEIKGNAEKLISSYKLMDENNKKAADVLTSYGIDSALEYMFKHPETGEKMDYATMRHYYG